MINFEIIPTCMNTILFDLPEIRNSLLPFTYTRPVADIRIGIMTIAQKWEKYLGVTPSYLCEPYLSKKYKTQHTTSGNLYINGAICPNYNLRDIIINLPENCLLTQKGMPIALKTNESLTVSALQNLCISVSNHIEFDGNITIIKFSWDIFACNGAEINADFLLITKNRKSEPITDEYTKTYHAKNIFIEPKANIKAAILNAENGPIYIGKNTEIQEGAIIRGPFALCEGATVNMGAKIKGDTSIGPYSKVGGEVSNSVIFGFSNKGHDGFLGNSVIGEWCNLGADTNTSNLKNNYSTVKSWHYPSQNYISTDKTFCGLMMGDHSKSSINTMFNTGTTVGVSANIFGSGFPEKFVQSFSWGNNSEKFDYEKAIEIAHKVMQRRGMVMLELDIQIFRWIFENGR